MNERLKLGRLVEEDVSLEPVRDGVLDLVGSEFAGRDLEDKVHLCKRSKKSAFFLPFESLKRFHWPSRVRDFVSGTQKIIMMNASTLRPAC